MERKMKVQEVILKAMAGSLKWWEAAEIIGHGRSLAGDGIGGGDGIEFGHRLSQIGRSAVARCAFPLVGVELREKPVPLGVLGIERLPAPEKLLGERADFSLVTGDRRRDGYAHLKPTRRCGDEVRVL